MNGGPPAWLPLVGDVAVVVRQAAPVSIHGDAYVDLLAGPEGEAPTGLRVPAHHFPTLPATGDRLRLHLLMRQVDRVDILEKRGEEA